MVRCLAGLQVAKCDEKTRPDNVYKIVISKFQSLKVKEKPRPLSAMNNSMDINLLYATFIYTFSFKSIGIIKKGAPWCYTLLRF